MQELQDTLLFARTFFTSPKKLGSAIPSSRFLVEAVIGASHLEGAKVIVEYGPGVGTITRHLLRHMRRDAVLIAIEMEHGLFEHLKRSFRDPRLRVVHGSAADVSKILKRLNIDRADTIISGIPFSTLPAPLREKIVASTVSALRESGTLVVYQFTASVLPLLKRHFREVSQRFVLRNVLPARVFECSQKREVVKRVA